MATRFARFHAVPVDDDRRQQVQPRDTVLLAFSRPITDFTKAIETERRIQGVVRFAFVEPDLSATLYVGIQHPVNHEQGTFGASDFTLGRSQFVLAGMAWVAKGAN